MKTSPVGTSPFLTHETVAAAIEALKPTIQHLLAAGKLKRGTMHIVVVNPFLAASSDGLEGWVEDGGILHEETVVIDDQICDASPYVEFARLKAYQTWRCGYPTGEVMARAPHLLQTGDTVYGGSATFCGLICAVSGQPAIMDEALAGMLLNLIVGQSRMAAAETIPHIESGVVG